MPAQTRSARKAPADRIYTSKPALQQAKFPGRRKTVTYEHRRTSRAADSKQQTLTQGGFLLPVEDVEIDLMEDEFDTPKKRRKTMGDSPSSSYHTQTLTQLYPSNGENLDHLQVLDSEDKGYDDLNSDLGVDDNDNRANVHPSKSPSVIPQTPTNRQKKTEIPSSQDTPLTPMLARYSPASRRSPLKDKSTNISSSMPKVLGSAKRTRFEVQDSCATTNSPLSTLGHISPEDVRISTAKKIRFATPPRRGSMILGEDDSGEEAATPTPKKKGTRSRREIPDSDEELEDLDEAETEEEVVYDAVGEDTQFHMDQLLSSSEKRMEHGTIELNLPSISIKTPDKVVASSGPATQDDRVEETPQKDTRRGKTTSLVPSSQETSRMKPSSPAQTAASSPTDYSTLETQGRTQLYTQGLESQRVHLDVIRAMAPQTNRSDIFISIHPEHVERIVAGTKNHEFRNYKIPAQVARMWIYATKPVAELRYMASISKAKEPGEIEDEAGIGNAEFNLDKKQGSYAYELLEVYELNNPVTLAGMKQNGWLEVAPQKYTYVPPAVVGQLMTNLRCSLFGGEEDDGEESAPSKPHVTVSQEIANQIRSDNALSTPHQSSQQEVVPSSQDSLARLARATGPDGAFRRPALPAHTYSRPANPTPRRATRASQATTASQASTPSFSPVRAVTQPTDSGPSLPLFGEDDEDDSPVRLPPSTFQLGSSQLLTRSQMLPESLLREDGRTLDVIWDSEEDDDDEV